MGCCWGFDLLVRNHCVITSLLAAGYLSVRRATVDRMNTETTTDTRRASLIALAAAFSDPDTPHADPEPAALARPWIRCIDAAHVISDRYRADYDAGGALCVIAEPTRVAALLHLVRAWTACVDAYLDGADHD